MGRWACIWKKERKEKHRPKTYITGVVQTSRQVELLIWPPGKQVRDRPTGGVPAAECSGSVPIGQLSLQSLTPSFSVDGSTTVNHGSVQLANIARSVSTSPNTLREKLIFGDTQLSRWHEVERVPTGKGVRGQIAWEV